METIINLSITFLIIIISISKLIHEKYKNLPTLQELLDKQMFIASTEGRLNKKQSNELRYINKLFNPIKLFSACNKEEKIHFILFKIFLKKYTIDLLFRFYKTLINKYKNMVLEVKKNQDKKALISRMNKAIKKCNNAGGVRVNNCYFPSSKIKEIAQEKTLYRSLEVLKNVGFVCDFIHNYDSNVNQEIKRKFVQNEVVTCLTFNTEFILGLFDEPLEIKPPFYRSDIENYLYYPECGDFEGGSEEEKEDFIGELEQKIERREDKLRTFNDRIINSNRSEEHIYKLEEISELLQEKIDELEQEKCDLEDLDYEYQEIYEWWEVSGYLLRQLKAYGHPVIEHECLWGRCTTGQAILLDYVISEICNNMEILEGQENEWAIR